MIFHTYYRTGSAVFTSLFMAFSFLAPIKAENTAAHYRQLGLSYRQQGRFNEAIAAMQKSVQLEPENTTAQINLGWTLHLANQEKEAAKFLWQAIYQKPFQDSAYNALGIVYLVDDNLNAAALIHTWAVILKPDNEVAYYNLSLTLHRLQLYNPAISAANYAAKLEPNNPHPLVSGAVAYWDNGNQSLAQNTYRQAINLDARYRNSEFLANLKQAAFSQEQIETAKQIVSSIIR